MSSKIKTKQKLQEHQVRALLKLDRSGGVVLNHSIGSGKTIVMLEAVRRYQDSKKGGKSLVIAPASLVSNIDSEIKKHGYSDIDRKRLLVMSYDEAVNKQDDLEKEKFNFVGLDEGQKLRNTNTKRHQIISHIAKNADKRLVASATVAYNKLSDIAPLYNIAAGTDILPEDPKAFDNRYLDKVLEQPPLLKRILGAAPKEKIHIKNKKDLKNRISQYADYYSLEDDPEAQKHFPKEVRHLVEVEMSPEQHRVYKYLEGRLPFHLRMKVRLNLPLDKKESSQLNAFSSGVRQVSNSVRPFMPNYEKSSPKIEKASQRLIERMSKDKNFRGVVYSNYLQAGLNDYSEELKKSGVNHSIYTGSLTAKQKDKLVEDYNSGKTPVLLVSSSGAEGLNLKGTKLIQIMEPHFNHSKIKQVVGRGSRFKSHEHLPEEEREMHVEMYHSVFPSTMLGKSKSHSIDQYLHHNSQTKHDLNEEFNKLIKED